MNKAQKARRSALRNYPSYAAGQHPEISGFINRLGGLRFAYNGILIAWGFDDGTVLTLQRGPAHLKTTGNTLSGLPPTHREETGQEHQRRALTAYRCGGPSA